ncbi:MAG TPA: hypothetical protein VNM90_05650 [Haliangium sp.]|nr:hypothetical protein [Haliangium sp.]
MNPVGVHPSSSHPDVTSVLFQPVVAGANVVEVQKGTTLYRIETTREGSGTVLHTYGIGTSPKQEAMMWFADGIGTSPRRPRRPRQNDALSLADGIGTSPDHERS